MKIRLLVLLLFVFISIRASFAADPYLTQVRFDSTVPSNCKNFEIRDFLQVRGIIVYGTKGAKAEKFTHEHRLNRDQARKLWGMLKSKQGQRLGPDVGREYLLLKQMGPKMGFDFMREGDVLEALALYELYREFPVQEYFITGGMAYSDAPGKRALGEIDIIVARRTDCAVIAIGEAKLGLGERNNAVSQLGRFIGFVRRKVCNRDSREPICQLR